MPTAPARFARLVLLRLLARSHSSLAAGLLVRNKEGDGLSTFVDMGVYTRNRWAHVTCGM
jgi:hypothetical protein